MSFQNPLPPGIRQVVPDYVSDGVTTVWGFPFRLWNVGDVNVMWQAGAASATFSAVGTLADNILTITNMNSGSVLIGAVLTSSGLAPETQVTQQLVPLQTGETFGGVGRYVVNIANQTLSTPQAFTGQASNLVWTPLNNASANGPLSNGTDFWVTINGLTSATITLAQAQPQYNLIRVQGLATPQRETSVVNDGVVQSTPLESELDYQVAIEQELRRDIDYAGNVQTFYDQAQLSQAEALASQLAAASSALIAAEEASVAAAIADTNWAIWPSRAAFAAAFASTSPGALIAVLVYGLTTSGDSPPMVYVRQGSPSPGYVPTAGGYYWNPTGNIVYPEQFLEVGAADDSAALHLADQVAVALGADLGIDRVHQVESAVTFASKVRFSASGRLKPTAVGLVTFSAGFEAALHQFIFDMSALSSGTGFPTASVTARAMTPQNFGAVENSPSSATANAAAFNAMNAAWVASGVDVDLTPCLFDIGAPVVIDFGGASTVGGIFKGRQAKTVLSFSSGVASPNFKFTNISGSYDSNGVTRSEFYGKISDFQVWGTPLVGSSTVGGVTMQVGEQAFVGSGPSAADTLAYFNGFKLEGLVVKNDAVNGGGYGLFLSGLTTFKLDTVTANAGGAYIDGSAAIVMQACSYGKLDACSTGSAAYGIWSPQGLSAENQTFAAVEISGHDFEVLGVAAIGNRSTQMQNNLVQGGFANMPYVLDSPVGQGNEIETSLYGGITTAWCTGQTAGLGAFGGYGWTLRQKNSNFIGGTYPYSSLTAPNLVANTWLPNIWGQDAIAYVYCNGVYTIAKRGFTDRSSGGADVVVGAGTSGVWTSTSVGVKSGESIMVSTSASVSSYWEPAT